MGLEMAVVKVPEVKVSVTVAALVTNRPLNVAMPLAGVAVGAVVVAFKFPPVVSRAVMAVAKEVTVLPLASWAVTTGWIVKACPATAVEAGCVVTASLLAVPGMTVSVPELLFKAPLVALIWAVPTRWPLKVALVPLAGVRSLAATPPVIAVSDQVEVGLARKLP